MIKITMRLYRLHDLDLMYLYKMPNVSIQAIIKVMLKNYVKDRSNGNQIATRFRTSDIRHNIPLPSTAQFHIILQDDEDGDVISWIEQIPKGIRNGMIKNMLRNYFDFPLIVPYEETVSDEKITSEDDSISIEKYNEVITQKATTKPYKRRKKSKDGNDVSDTEKSTNKTKKQKTKKNTVSEVLDKPVPSSEEKIMTSKTADDVLKNNSQTKIVEDDNTESDLFDDFESMMNNF